jgi:cellulose synthase/poly-beta-1,6-N-acetylglucosamine synthase-like glycosyltransferase
MATHMTTTPVSPRLTVAVITLNEAKRIEQCLHSASFADELIVVDSGSTDGTQALAKQMGAQVFEYPDWQGFGVQRNRLLAHSTGDYIFFLGINQFENIDIARPSFSLTLLSKSVTRETEFFET